MMKQVAFQIEGIAPLFLHNSQAASPLSQFSKAMKKITAKRKKTEEDHEALALIEWASGMYGTEPGEVTVDGASVRIKGFGVPCIPSDNLERMLVDAATKQKLGKVFKAAVFVDGDTPIKYAGPKTVEKLFGDPQWIDSRLSKVGQATVLRTRPIFHEWSLEFNVNFLPSELEESQVRDAVDTASRIIGLGDWRPKYGRFIVKSAEVIQ